ncbi:MAG: CBS domain-containing protein [Gemmatimonadota bacterium]|nr:CBS domain-containing protein [Gemmatimonadota bacterium]
MDEELRVEHALSAIRYRIYPDTPFDEVLDLMIRRQLHAIPVVGEDYEVLGIITTGDVLHTLLKRRGKRGTENATAEPGTLAARDVMTRTVLCVAEEQLLTEAAQMMANRDVEQLPVVRDGTLVGFLTRDSLLESLWGKPKEADADKPRVEGEQ